MAKQVTFSVSKRDGPSVEVTFSEPENLSDPRWNEIVSDKEADCNALALKALRVAIQAGAREHLEGGQKAVQEYVDSYQYKAGARGPRAAKPKPISKETQKKAKFTAAQLEALKEAGFLFEE